MNDLDAIAFQEETGMSAAVARYRDVATDKAIARRFTIEAIDEAIRDLQEARTYVLVAKALEKAA